MAVAALFLYSLLPIVRNTHAGLTGIPAALCESAGALGLTAIASLVVYPELMYQTKIIAQDRKSVV